jgi:hypothetical protein
MDYGRLFMHCDTHNGRLSLINMVRNKGVADDGLKFGTFIG